MKVKEWREKQEGLDYPVMDSFTNEYGEEFHFFSNGSSVWFGGDETDNEVINLFNRGFDIWSAEEMAQIGDTLIALSTMIINESNRRNTN